MSYSPPCNASFFQNCQLNGVDANCLPTDANGNGICCTKTSDFLFHFLFQPFCSDDIGNREITFVLNVFSPFVYLIWVFPSIMSIIFMINKKGKPAKWYFVNKFTRSLLLSTSGLSMIMIADAIVSFYSNRHTFIGKFTLVLTVWVSMWILCTIGFYHQDVANIITMDYMNQNESKKKEIETPSNDNDSNEDKYTVASSMSGQEMRYSVYMYAKWLLIPLWFIAFVLTIIFPFVSVNNSKPYDSYENYILFFTLYLFTFPFVLLLSGFKFIKIGKHDTILSTVAVMSVSLMVFLIVGYSYVFADKTYIIPDEMLAGIHNLVLYVSGALAIQNLGVLYEETPYTKKNMKRGSWCSCCC